MFTKTAQSYKFKIVNNSGVPVDLTTLTGNVVWTATGGNSSHVIGPKNATINDAVNGRCTVNLLPSDLMFSDTYKVSIVIGAPINRSCFLGELKTFDVPVIKSVAITASQDSVFNFQLKDNNKQTLDLTGKSVVFYTVAVLGGSASITGTVSVTDAASGLVDVTVNMANSAYGYFLVDSVITNNVYIAAY